MPAYGRFRLATACLWAITAGGYRTLVKFPFQSSPPFSLWPTFTLD